MVFRYFILTTIFLALTAHLSHAKEPCPENRPTNNWYECTGSVTYEDGSSYTGDWKYGKRHGGGTFTFADGSVYQGNSKRGKFKGTGKVTYPNGNTYEGEWKNDKPHGEGVLLDMQAGVKTTGIWKSGKLSKVTSQASFSPKNTKPKTQSMKREAVQVTAETNSRAVRGTSRGSATEVTDVNFDAFAKSLLNHTMEGSRLAVYFDSRRSEGIDSETFRPYAAAAVNAVEYNAREMGVMLFDTTELERIGNFMAMQAGEDYDLQELRKIASVDLLAVITAFADRNNKTQIMAKVIDVSSNAGRIIGVAKPEYVNLKVFYEISFEGAFKLDVAGNQLKRLSEYESFFISGLGNHPDVTVSVGDSDSATHTAVAGLSVETEVDFDAKTRAEYETKIKGIEQSTDMLKQFFGEEDNIFTKAAKGGNAQSLQELESKKRELYFVTAKVSGIDQRSNGPIEVMCEASDSITVLASDREKSALLNELGRKTAECAGQNFIARITGSAMTSVQTESDGPDF